MDNSNNKQQPEAKKQPEVTAVTPEATPPRATEASSYQMPPKKKLSKGALWGIIGGVIGLVVLIVGVILAVVFLGGPTREDYNQALRYMGDFEIGDTSALMSSTPEEMTKRIDDMTKKADEYFATLGSYKAMRDDEVKKAFDAYKGEWDKARPLFQSLGKITREAKQVQQSCKSTFISFSGKTGEQYGAAFDEQNGACLKALEELKKSDIKVVAEQAEAQEKYLKALREYGVAMANRSHNRDYTSPMPTYPTRPAGSGFTSAMYKQFSDIKITDREKDLANLLREKIRK